MTDKRCLLKIWAEVCFHYATADFRKNGSANQLEI
jgi:hypothetical protein